MLALVVALSLAAPQAASSDPRAEVAAFVARHCARCHDADTQKGMLDLVGAAARDLDGVRADVRLWRRVDEAVRTRVMPPKRTRRPPDDREREGFHASLAAMRRAAADAGAPDPGAPTLRRLNRTQYRNTVRDLLGVDLPGLGDLLPEDPRGYGFDTVGDVLFTSPVLVERYWEATRQALDALFEDRAALDDLCRVRPEDGGDPARAAERTLRPVLRRAFRRPVDQRELRQRVALVDAAQASGGTFEDGLRRALASVLLSPHFLYRVERERPAARAGAAYRLTDHELAVRVAYFLWSTMPDDELSRLADRGVLGEPQVLRAQVDRMLDDPRARSLADEFGAQWLGYGELTGLARDVRRFGGFGRLRTSMYEEAALCVDALFREDRSVLELLDADTTFVDEGLAKHYGIDDVSGSEMRRVAVPADRRRGGVLGWAATLTATSTPLRTSPVVRGRFVLEELLGDPPAPPPPDAGVLPEDDQLDDGLTLRERLERHRSEPRCASCHARIDPYGLALEEFDGIGRFRAEAYGRPVDSRAELPDGTVLVGVVGVKDHLLARRDTFVRVMVERLLVYALGRPLDGADVATVERIVDGVARDGYRARAMVWRVVRSFPFRQRRNA